MIEQKDIDALSALGEEEQMKTLHNTDINGATKNVPDIKTFGDGDTWQLICKASSEKEGWMKSTKAMEIEGVGCLVQVTTQQRNPDGSYSLAEAVTFVPETYVSVSGSSNDDVNGRCIRRAPHPPLDVRE